MCVGEQKPALLVQIHRRATVAKIAEEVNTGYDRKVTEHTLNCSLQYMELYSDSLVRLHMLDPVAHQKNLQ